MFECQETSLWLFLFFFIDSVFTILQVNWPALIGILTSDYSPNNISPFVTDSPHSAFSPSLDIFILVAIPFLRAGRGASLARRPCTRVHV